MSGSKLHSIRGQVHRIVRAVAFVWPFIRGRALISVALLIAAGLTEGISILLVIPVLASLMPGAADVNLGLGDFLPDFASGFQFRVDLEVLLVLLVVAIAFQAALSRLSTLTMADATLKAAHMIRIQLFEAVGYSRWHKLMTGRHADITHALTMDVDRLQVVISNILLIAQALIMLAVYVVLSFVVSPSMTAAAVIFGVVFLGLLHPLRNFASRYGERLSLQRQVQYRTVGEFLSGLKVVKSLNAEDRYVDTFARNSEDLTRDVVMYYRVTALPTYLFQVISAAAAAAFIFVAVRVMAMPIEQIAVLLLLFMRISPRFTALQTQYQSLILNVGAYDNLHDILNTYNLDLDRPEPGSRARLGFDHQLAFKGVRFRYGSTSPDVLHDVSFVVPARRITALIGPSGSGKTTAADIMLGLLEPVSGSMEVDGFELDLEGRRRWREGIAYVPQETYLSNGTIRSNLAFAVPQATEADMWLALEQAQAKELVLRLSDGLDARVGEGGINLSGGERQRIALARALLRKPDLLILDEATSALDWQNQALIAKAIQSLGGQVTVVTIAHRPSMIAFADWVVAFEDGKVVETGLFSDFARREGSQLSNMLAGEAVEQGSTPGKAAT